MTAPGGPCSTTPSGRPVTRSRTRRPREPDPSPGTMTDVSTAQPGTDLASFLSAYPPFDRLDDAERTALADAARVEEYAAGELVLDAFAVPSVELFVVVSGRVDVWDDPARVKPDEVLGPGGLFGFSAMLTERSVGPRAVAGRSEE